MSICTAAQAVSAMEYWVGYCEKKDATAKYLVKSKDVFTANAGSDNYTYMGKLFGCNGGSGAAWCAMTVTEAIYSACGSSSSDAKTVMHGVYPYLACNQLYDAASSAYKGKRGYWMPKAGDVIVFSSNGTTRQHTGMVYNCSNGKVYTIEGNVSNKCVKKSYSMTDSYIYGYVRPKYKDASGSNGTADYKEYIKKYQKWLNEKYSGGLTVDGEYGPLTRTASIKALQTWLNKSEGADITVTGKFDAATKVSFKKIDNQAVDKGDANDSVYILQGMLFCKGYSSTGFDGIFGSGTLAAVKSFQSANGLAADGEAGADTWTALFKA